MTAERWPLFIFALAVIWLVLHYSSDPIRYKTIIEVEIDGRISSYSGVCEIKYQRSFLDFEGWKWWTLRHCEAIPIDLGMRGLLFAVAPIEPPKLISNGFYPDYVGLSGLYPELTFGTSVREVPLSNLPLIVRFDDTKDPDSIHDGEAVEFDQPPMLGNKNLAKDFGIGVKLVRERTQIVWHGLWPFNSVGARGPEWLTGVPVTTGIENYLPWLSKKPERVPIKSVRFPLNYTYFKVSDF